MAAVVRCCRHEQQPWTARQKPRPCPRQRRRDHLATGRSRRRHHHLARSDPVPGSHSPRLAARCADQTRSASSSVSAASWRKAGWTRAISIAAGHVRPALTISKRTFRWRFTVAGAADFPPHSASAPDQRLTSGVRASPRRAASGRRARTGSRPPPCERRRRRCETRLLPSRRHPRASRTSGRCRQRRTRGSTFARGSRAPLRPARAPRGQAR